MTGKSVEVKEVRIPVDEIRKLSPEQRYAYYLLGLIHNEALALRKLITYCRPAKGDSRPFRRSPELSQALLLFRIACGKLYEARLQLNSRIVRNVLVNDVFPAWNEGEGKLRALNKLAASANWLSGLRNKVGFHYPKFEDWLAVTTPDDTWVDDIVYVGEEAGNQFFDGPEALVRNQMFMAVEGESMADQVDTWIRQAVDLLVALSDFSEYAVGYFAIHRLLGGETPEGKTLGKVTAPRLDEVTVPFWTRPASKKRAA